MWRGGLRFASVRDGGPSVVMGGLRQSPLLSVMTLDMNHQMVYSYIIDFRERRTQFYVCLSCAGSDYSVRPATNSMPVFIKTVRCTSRQLSLLECGFRRNLTHSVHLEDVGVKCKKCKNAK